MAKEQIRCVNLFSSHCDVARNNCWANSMNSMASSICSNYLFGFIHTTNQYAISSDFSFCTHRYDKSSPLTECSVCVCVYVRMYV